MRAAFSDFLIRRRHTVLTTAAAAAALIMLISAVGPREPGTAIALLATLTVLGALYVLAEPPPRDELLVTDGAFTTPGSGTLVIIGVAHLALITACFAAGVQDDEIRAPWSALMIALTAPLAGYGFGLWHGIGVTLTARGLTAGKLSGAMVIPWAALAVPQPRQSPDPAPAGPVVLTYARPELITVTGWPADRDRIVFARTSRHFAATAVRHYAENPHDRPAIGTMPAYERLREMTAVAPANRPPLPARSRRWIAVRAVTGGLLTGIALILFAWTDTRLDGHGILVELPQLLLFAVLLGLGRMTSAIMAAYRRRHPHRDPPADQPPSPAPGPPWAYDVTNPHPPGGAAGSP